MLQPGQWRNIKKRYDATNEEWREEWMEGSADKRLRHRIKQALSRLEDFYGRLDAPQRTVLEQWITHSGFDPAQSYAARLRRQADSLQTLQRMAQAGEASATTQALLRGWIDRSFNSPIERHRAYGQALWQENCEGFAKLHNSTTPAQRQHLAESLRGYENDFRNLMSKK